MALHETKLCKSIAEVAAWAKSVRAIKADLVIVDAPGAMAFGASIAVCDLARGAAETVKLVRQHRRASGQIFMTGKPTTLAVTQKTS